jgi:Na+/H+-dicarboxylate symporter
VPLAWRILIGFALGIAGGLLAQRFASPEALARILPILSPFGGVLVAMLKMVVYPIILFSLVMGAASLPLRQSGKVGGTVVVWYVLTSLVAAILGVALALALNPSMAQAGSTATAHAAAAQELVGKAQGGGTFAAFFLGLFVNPFEALAKGNFLPIIVFAILVGVAARCLLDSGDAKAEGPVRSFLTVCDGAQRISFKLIDWVMLYFPFGVFALTFTNFAENGPLLFGPYLRIVACVLVCVLVMMFVVYPAAIALFRRENPFRVLAHLRAPMLTAFVTRSSAATLPVSFRAMDEAGVPRAISSFSLPLGATVNMDGVCVHLPVFAILAANMFGMELSAVQLLTLVVSVMFASIGAGGVPGGSVFLLFMVLENMNLAPDQVSLIVALALGINPILDMFETCCNVTGDTVCTYIVARKNGLVHKETAATAD